MNIVLTILAAIIVFGIIIFVHELGHFAAAKLSGIRVLEFALGMGPKLISFTRGETVYSLRLFPVGGFCAMEGEDEESSGERAFCNAKLWKRVVVTVAGSAMNLLLGFLICLVFTAQKDILPTVTISQFHGDAVSSEKLQVGDSLYRVNGTRVRTAKDLEYVFMRALSGEMEIEVVRGGEVLNLGTVTFMTKEIEEMGSVPIFDFNVHGEALTFGNAITYSLNETGNQVRMIWGSLADLISGRYGLSAISGPVGITTVIGEATSSSYSQGYAQGGFWAGVQAGLMTMLQLMCLISVNLGVMNLLPIPALDGGRLLFLLVEAIRRKPVPQKYEGAVTAVGFMLLIGIIIAVTVKDVIMLF